MAQKRSKSYDGPFWLGHRDFEPRTRRKRTISTSCADKAGMRNTLAACTGRLVPIPQAKRKTTLDRVVFFCQRAVKRCVKVGKNSKKYTKSKLFNASKKVLFVLRDKRLHICFTCAKRNYTFQKTSVIISPDIYLQGIFGQFLFIWIFILLGFFCKINYV